MQNTWMIVATEPQRERVFADGLRMRGVEPYSPIVWRTVRKRQGVMHDVKRPLFPGYAFVPVAGAEQARVTTGFWQFLRREDQEVAVLGDEAIEFVRLVEAQIEAKRQFEILKRSRKQHDFAVGQNVRLVSGPLSDFTARIERLDGSSQLRLLLEMFGRPTPVVVQAHEIEAA